MAELLIVVAIIAVLVAIAIPVFTAQLEKSRESTDEANLRAAYAAAQAAVLGDEWDDTKPYYKSDGSFTATAADAIEGKSSSTDAKLASYDVPLSDFNGTQDVTGKHIKVTVTNGAVSKVSFE